ncbi:hypothetical protein EYZ11_007457 [Aspergillus tanneri]|nr:hypothetical protein EYZ11_007457 [Aspergillus tanneri]
MEADKIKKKLNGSILKGRKFSVEAARPQKRYRDEEVSDIPASTRKSSVNGEKKKKKSENGVLDGYELPLERHVKRGWTEPTIHKNERRKEEKKKGKTEKSTKSQSKSKYTEKPECLFRTNIPPNRSTDEKQEKRSKKKKKSTQELVVHEFAKTATHPSFLRSTGDEAAPTSIFEDDRGWIDESGNVKEQVSDRIRKAQYRPGAKSGAEERRRSLASGTSDVQKPGDTSNSQENETANESEDWTSSSGSASSDDSSSDSDSNESVSSSSSNSEASSHNEVPKAPANFKVADKVHGHDNFDSKSKGNNKESSTEANETSHSQEVHPLEALFKRPAPESTDHKPDSQSHAQFSFFGQGDIDSEEETEFTAPQTPFTKKDLQNRGLRSAAPTPDTALFSRTVNRDMVQGEYMDVDDELYTNTPVPKTGAGQRNESEFSKWFWETRGDNNRAWKKRRREAAKEQRQRENRKKGMRGKF